MNNWLGDPGTLSNVETPCVPAQTPGSRHAGAITLREVAS
jgi:hypothetical protein